MSARPDAGVHVTLARPDVHGATRHLLEVRAEEHVGQEQDLFVFGDRADHALGVAGGAAVVAERFHLGGRVDVRDDDRAGVLSLPGSELSGVDRRGKRAACRKVGDEHSLARAQDHRRLGHEVDTAEHDHVGSSRGRLARKAERVADVVGHVLDLGHLVVVGEDDRVALARQLADLLAHALRCHEGRCAERTQRHQPRGSALLPPCLRDLQAQIQRRRGVRQRPYRDSIHPGLGRRHRTFQRHAT